MCHAILLLAAILGGPETIQPVFVRTGPAPEETREFQDTLEEIIRRNWKTLLGVRGFILEAGSEFNESRQAVFYARLTALDGEMVEFPAIPIRKTTPREAAEDVWQNVFMATKAKELCGTMKLCPAACTLSYSRDGPPASLFLQTTLSFHRAPHQFAHQVYLILPLSYRLFRSFLSDDA